MIDMVRRHEIQVLRRAGHRLAETATLVGVSQSSVQRVAAEPPVMSFDTDAERAKREVGRPSKAEPFRAWAWPWPTSTDPGTPRAARWRKGFDLGRPPLADHVGPLVTSAAARCG
jgi:hypothetical protein